MPIVNADDFYADVNRRIWAAITSLSQAGKPTEPVTLSDELRRLGIWESNADYVHLVALWDSNTSGANAVYYANIIWEKSVLRTLIHAGNELARDANDSVGPPGELLDAAQAKLSRIAEHGFRDGCTAAEASRLSIDRVKERSTEAYRESAVLTGWTDLDNRTGGFQEGELVVVAARTSVGKTAFALNVAYALAIDAGVPVLFVSLEQPPIEIGDRLNALCTGINSFKIRRPDRLEPEALTQADGFFETKPLRIEDTPNQTTLRIAAATDR